MCLCPCHCPAHCDAILLDEDDIFEFRIIPYNSWIPSSALALSAISLGAVLIHLTSATLWFVSLVLWILAGVMLAKVKYERYTFDKIAGTVKITRRSITGTRIKTYALSNIKEIIYEKERDLQGGDDVQLFMKLENGKEVKLLAGHFCGIRAKLKKLLKKKLEVFLENIPNLTHVQILKEKKKKSKFKLNHTALMDHLVSPAPLKMNSLLRRVLQNEKDLTASVIVTHIHSNTATPLRVRRKNVKDTDVLVADQTPKKEEELFILREI